MYPTSGQLILGFHGCDRKVGEAVLAGEKILEPSQNDWDWLGAGVYFWESDLLRAQEFAYSLKSKKTSKVNEPFVVGAVLELGRCLNFLNREYIELLKKVFQIFQETTKMAGEDLPTNKSGKDGKDFLIRDLDCAVIKFLHNSVAEDDQQPFDSVRAAFWEGEELYPGAGFRELNHIQLCIRNTNCIKGYFRPLVDDPKSLIL